MTLTSHELREKYLAFFAAKNHTIIPSASLIPENDPTVLFTTAGMHPLVPYLIGEKHPGGARLADVQKCVRTGDIDDVGDASHCTFFEMLGNWSLGDYFKKEAIAYSWEFLTSPDWLGIDPSRLYFTCFEGDADAPRDMVSFDCWRNHGVAEDHIFFLPKKYNWWGPAGQTGPCGPDSEMFIDTGKPACSQDCSPACDCGKFLEIWNNVFMEFNKRKDGTFEPLAQQNVDTGMGLDRTLATLQGVSSVYETDAFALIIAAIERLSSRKYGQDDDTTRAMRIVADHIRCATFLLGDERAVKPSNVDQGYVLRRLIRRAIRFAQGIGIESGHLSDMAEAVLAQYGAIYPELQRNRAFILAELATEEERFARTLKQGLKLFERLAANLQGDLIDGTSAFHLYDTFGFPIEFTVELAREKGLRVDMDGYEQAFRKHQETSQSGAAARFKGGLADNTEQTARLHTATHLLHAALRKVLGAEVAQKGSNITAERLRFDFSFSRKMAPEEIAQVQQLVNDAIKADYAVECEEMPLDIAKTTGAIGLFESKYDTVVRVYSIGDFSKEICGGPHAVRTGELISFKIQKEESSSAGVRRIKAVIG